MGAAVNNQNAYTVLINGKNVILAILTGESPQTFTVLGCARNVRLTYNTDTAEKTTVGSGTNKEYKPLVTSWSGTIDGLSSDDNVTTRELLQYVQNLSVLFMQFDLGDGGVPLNGDIILSSVEAAGTYNDAATYNVSFQGTGQLII